MQCPNASGTATENLCVWVRGMRWPYGRHRERSRGAAETTSSHGGEGLCAKEITWVPVPERTGRGFPGPRRLRSNDGPCCDGCRGRILPDSASAALCDLISWPANRGVRPVMSEWAVDPTWRSQPPWGPEAAFQKLILSLLLFQKLPKFFLLFFSPRLLHSFCLSFPVGCHHSLVTEKLGNLPEGQGETGWLRRKEQKQTLPPVGTGR